jgi:SepF-like predicted cell division protein (DUF552 family)
LKGVLDRLVRHEEDEKVLLGRSVYVKSIPLKSYQDVEAMKAEVKAGNIVITNISPLAKCDIDEVMRSIDELNEFVRIQGGDIARLGEDRVILTPRTVKIWREKPGE